MREDHRTQLLPGPSTAQLRKHWRTKTFLPIPPSTESNLLLNQTFRQRKTKFSPVQLLIYSLLFPSWDARKRSPSSAEGN